MLDNIVPIVSFPKSGNTFVRLVLGDILFGNAGFKVSNMNQYMPPSFNKCLQERVFYHQKVFPKMHANRHQIPIKFNKYVYLVRNPLDAIQSYHLFSNARHNRKLKLKSFLKTYSRDWGHWSFHVDSWKKSEGEGLFIRYEDLMTKPYCVFKDILEFMEVDCHEGALRAAIKQNSVEKQSHSQLSELMKSRDKSYIFAGKRDWSRSKNNRDLVRKFLSKHDPQYNEYMLEFGYEI